MANVYIYIETKEAQFPTKHISRRHSLPHTVDAGLYGPRFRQHHLYMALKLPVLIPHPRIRRLIGVLRRHIPVNLLDDLGLGATAVGQLDIILQ